MSPQRPVFPLSRLVGWVAAVGVAVAGGGGITAQRADGTRDVDAAISAIVTDFMAKSSITGISVAIGRRDRIVLAKGFGRSDLSSNTPLDRNAVMDIGSVGKQFTAAAVLKLVEDGRVNLDRPLTRYLPSWTDGGRGITVRQLLTHTSGIEDPAFSEDAPEPRFLKPVTAEGLLAFISAAPFRFPPQRTWYYSNAGYKLLGLMLERVHGKSYAQVIEDTIAKPLGLKTLVYCDKTRPIPNRVRDYILHKGKAEPIPPIDVSWFGGAGSLCATASDLVRWEQAIIAGRALSSASVEAMHEPSVIRHEGMTLDVEYGFGRAFGRLRGHRKIAHGGAGAGISAILARYPDDDWIVAVMINAAGQGVPHARTLEARIADELLATSEVIEPADVPVNPAQAAAWSGTYRGSFGLSSARVFACEGDGLCAARSAGPGLRLAHRGRGVFAGPLGPESELRFEPPDRRALWVVHTMYGVHDNVLLRVEPPNRNP